MATNESSRRHRRWPATTPRQATSPRRFGPESQAALAARAVHAYGEAAEQAERALELWPRVPNAAQSLPLDHVDLMTLAAAAHGVAGDRARAEVLFEHALNEVDSGLGSAALCPALGVPLPSPVVAQPRPGGGRDG